MSVLIRPYRDEDASAAVAFVADAAKSDPTLVPVSEDGWREFTAMSYNQGARGFAVAEEDGELVALLMSQRSGAPRHFRILVHPRVRRRGIGTRMLAYVEAQDDEPVRYESEVVGGWDAGRAFLARAGFVETRRDFEMTRDGPPPDAVSPPAGVVLRQYIESPDDDAAWKRLNDEAYKGTHGYSGLSGDDLTLMRNTEEFHLWFAVRDKIVVGLCHTKVWQGHTACVNSVVVTPSERGTGLGRALFVAGVRTLIAANPERTVSLWVRADNAPALAIYRSYGFNTKSESATWAKEPPGAF